MPADVFHGLLLRANRVLNATGKKPPSGPLSKIRQRQVAFKALLLMDMLRQPYWWRLPLSLHVITDSSSDNSSSAEPALRHLLDTPLPRQIMLTFGSVDAERMQLHDLPHAFDNGPRDEVAIEQRTNSRMKRVLLTAGTSECAECAICWEEIDMVWAAE